MISYSKFGGDTFMFRILDMIDEVRVFCFIFEDGVEFYFVFWYLSIWVGGFLVVVKNYFRPSIGKRKGFKVNWFLINIKLCT